tara:strand:- start:2635 stop:3039 length:405 start_codon:yes stop_codon:yes gene_type:complete
MDMELCIMKLDDQLTPNTYMMYAMKHYDNPQCIGMDEFQEDLNRIKYIKRLFRKYRNNDILRERLLLNHIIIFYNVFGVEPATRILFYKIEEEMHDLLKTFLVYLNYLPEEDIPEAKLVEIPLDQFVINKLREL